MRCIREKCASTYLKKPMRRSACAFACIILSLYLKTSKIECLFLFLFLLWFNVPVNNFSVMLRRSHLFLGITSTFLGSKCLLLKESNTPTRPRIEPGSPDPESDALTIRPVRPPKLNVSYVNGNL